MKQPQSGEFLVEYALATLCVLIALLVPIPPATESILQILLDAVRDNANHVDAAIALP